MTFITHECKARFDDESSCRHLKRRLYAWSDEFKDFSARGDSYNAALERYQHIATADFYAICAPIDQLASQELLFAMLHDKPIILTQLPIFEKDVDLFTRDAIYSRLSKIFVCELLMLDDNDLVSFVRNILKPVNYSLTKHQVAIIRGRVKTHFRELLAAETP